MKFTFKARTEEGKIKRGTIEASSEKDAIKILHSNNLVPLDIKNDNRNKSLSRRIEEATTRVPAKDVLVFFREFSTLVGAQVPISPAMKTIHEQTENKAMRAVTKTIGNDVEDGLSISESFAKFPKIFSPLVVNMIRSGEVSGNLQGSIEYVTRIIEQNHKLRSQVFGALMYPAFVVVISIVLGFVVVTWILPKLTMVIRDMDIEIPWYTKFMIALGDFMQVYWWVVIVAFAAFAASIVYYFRTDDGKIDLDHIKLKLPILGTLFKYVYITRFSENLSILIIGGIPIVQALNIIADVVDNDVYSRIINEAANDVRVGGEISSTFFKYEAIPPMVARMLRVGEETGRISSILEDIAKFYRSEVDQITKNISSLVEPILIVILGIGVGTLVISVLLPIYNIAGQI